MLTKLNLKYPLMSDEYITTSCMTFCNGLIHLYSQTSLNSRISTLNIKHLCFMHYISLSYCHAPYVLWQASEGSKAGNKFLMGIN